MSINQSVKNLRDRLVDHSGLNGVAEKSGVTYSWLIKFSRGTIKNPTVANVAKLEAYFDKQNDTNDLSC